MEDHLLKEGDSVHEEEVVQITDQCQYTATENNKSGDIEKENAKKTNNQRPKRKQKLLRYLLFASTIETLCIHYRMMGSEIVLKVNFY